MKGKKSILAALLMVSMLFPILAACGDTGNGGNSTDPAASDSDKEVTLQYYTWQDEEKYARLVVDRFMEEHSNIKVNLNILPANDYADIILTTLAGGKSIDILSVNGITYLNQYASKEAIMDLTGLIQESGIDVSAYGTTYQNLAIGGKQFMLPYRSSAHALFYNKDLFEQAGIPAPGPMTWDEYAELAQKLTTGEGNDKQWGGFIPNWMRSAYITTQKNSSLIDDDTTPIKDWLVFLDRLYNVDKSHMSFSEMKNGSVDWIKLFEAGKVAMMPNGEWTITNLNADIAAGNANVNYGVAPLPTVNAGDEVVVPGGPSTYLSIASSSKHPKEAFEFVKFYSGAEGAKILAEASVLPAMTNEEINQVYLNATGIDGSDALLNSKAVQEMEPIPQAEDVGKVYDEEKELYLIGEQDIDKTMDNFIDRREEALK